MKIALYELYKALKSKVLLILFVALFLLNLALSATYTPVPGVPDECIREINKVYLSTSEEEKAVCRREYCKQIYKRQCATEYISGQEI